MTSVSVFTLNCWGLGMGVSRDRVVRMRAIGQHLATTDYDVVCLQEVWCTQDYQTIRHLARQTLPYQHFFDHGIIGSGTCILSKYQIVDAAFHEFSLNGYPHKILHGDWFAGKGVGVCNINLSGLELHVFVSHYHAEYDRSNDQYTGHRVMQALEAAQWIKLTSAGADMTIYAGDFNTEPCDTPYWILRSVAGLTDSWSQVHGEDSGHTCDTRDNSYSSAGHSRGKRIDYIMYRPGQHSRVRTVSCELPLSRRIPASLGRDVSYSDHEAVTSVLSLESVSPGVSGDHQRRQLTQAEVQKREDTLHDAVKVIDKAYYRTKFDQKFYSVLSALIWVAFWCTFAQLLSNSLMLECGMFLLRLMLSLSGVYTLLMATIFNRRERHALSATRATLSLLAAQSSSYGSI